MQGVCVVLILVDCKRLRDTRCGYFKCQAMCPIKRGGASNPIVEWVNRVAPLFYRSTIKESLFKGSPS
jgi:hypothetical protein